MSLLSLPKRSTLIAIALVCNGVLPAGASAATGLTASIQHGQQLAQTCAACHGPDGNSRAPELYPNLAAQAPAYLELQLANFKSGERPHAVMKAIATALKPGEAHDLSVYFSAQPAKAQPSSNAALEEKGRIIFTKGGANGALACASCHGAQGQGQSAFPRVASQPAGYLLEQLHVYRDAPAFNNPLATMMKGVAVKLSEEEMKAVAAYVATLH